MTNKHMLLPLSAALLCLTGCSLFYTNVPTEEVIETEEYAAETAPEWDSVEQALRSLCYGTSTDIAFSSAQSDRLAECLDIIGGGVYSEYYHFTGADGTKVIQLSVMDGYMLYESNEDGEYNSMGSSILLHDGKGFCMGNGTVSYPLTVPEEKRYRSILCDLENADYQGTTEMLDVGDKQYRFEQYVTDTLTYYLALDESDTIRAMAATDGSSAKLATEYKLTATDSILNEEWMSGRMAYYRTCLDEAYADELHYENDIFDFSAERIRGEDIENPHIVEFYRDFFDTADSFTFSRSSQRGDLYMEDYHTRSGEDYLDRTTTQKGVEKAILSDCLRVDGQYYSQCIYEDETEDWHKDVYNDDFQPEQYIDGLLQRQKPDAYREDPVFMEAYMVTIGEEEYICEVWDIHSKYPVRVYCQDGRIVAMDSIFYDIHEETIIETFTETADMEKLTAPEKYSQYSDSQESGGGAVVAGGIS